MLRDNMQARIMQPDGSYVRITNDEEPVSAQGYFYEKAYEQAN